MKLEPGSQTPFLITSEKDLGEIIGYSFRYVSNSLLFPPKMQLEYIKITPMNVATKKMDLRKLVATVCPSDPLTTNSVQQLSEDNCK